MKPLFQVTRYGIEVRLLGAQRWVSVSFENLADLQRRCGEVVLVFGDGTAWVIYKDAILEAREVAESWQ